jgi:hypothetical protein
MCFARHKSALGRLSDLRTSHACRNYFLDGRINRAEILFPGVVCFLIAAITGLLVHASNVDDHNTKLGRKSKGWLRK